MHYLFIDILGKEPPYTMDEIQKVIDELGSALSEAFEVREDIKKGGGG